MALAKDSLYSKHCQENNPLLIPVPGCFRERPFSLVPHIGEKRKGGRAGVKSAQGVCSLTMISLLGVLCELDDRYPALSGQGGGHTSRGNARNWWRWRSHSSGLQVRTVGSFFLRKRHSGIFFFFHCREQFEALAYTLPQLLITFHEKITYITLLNWEALCEYFA